MSWRRGQRYSQDLRGRILATVDAGGGVYRVAEIFGVSVSYIYKALDRRRKTGDSGANPNRGHRPRKLTPAQEAALEARIGSEADITLARLQDWLLAEHGVRLSDGAIWMAVHRLKLSFKKKPAGRRTRSSRRGRPAPDLARRAELRRS